MEFNSYNGMFIGIRISGTVMSIDKLLEIARAAYSGVTQYNVEINGRLLEKLLAEIKAGRELSDHDYILQDTSVVTLTRNYNEAREALDAELGAV